MCLGTGRTALSLDFPGCPSGSHCRGGSLEYAPATQFPTGPAALDGIYLRCLAIGLDFTTLFADTAWIFWFHEFP